MRVKRAPAFANEGPRINSSSSSRTTGARTPGISRFPSLRPSALRSGAPRISMRRSRQRRTGSAFSFAGARLRSSCGSSRRSKNNSSPATEFQMYFSSPSVRNCHWGACSPCRKLRPGLAAGSRSKGASEWASTPSGMGAPAISRRVGMRSWRATGASQVRPVGHPPSAGDFTTRGMRADPSLGTILWRR